ncbi:DUF4433 domain-containing protein [Maribacter sp. MJ134]|uniref:type II toxin-antitoxin system toxin DNA ADP-ribosyl transferase DarT n=1 Tax=Maribacter sp. MJ134 TaxID=2496865 RepID=UPI000F832BD0|nr:DUF4433 domain-containing protein [Maribacter sp. MJ134]AZQ59732.1 DUF4433 domain-containing protein [Maribacter sp. MJ134]
MTHIENIPHIIKNGITHKKSEHSNKTYKSIGDNSLIGTRDTFEMPNGELLGDYIPFYLGLRTPMLYVIQNGYNGVTSLHPSKIVYCVSSIQRIIEKEIDFVYTDGHATDSFTKYYTPADIDEVENQVDFNATKAKFWKDDNDLDLKRRKEAEFLIKQNLGYNDILGFAVYNDEAKNQLLEFGINTKKLATKPSLYF